MVGWHGKKTKTSKKREMNPTDAYRKQQRNKEKKRNKLERKQVRDDSNLIKNPHLIKEELDKLNYQSMLAQLDATGVKRREKLENLMFFVKQKLHSEKITREAQLNGYVDDAYIALKEVQAKAKEIEKVDDEEEEETDSSEYSETDEEDENEIPKNFSSLNEAPPLPPGPPPIQNLTNLQPLSLDFTKLSNPEHPIRPPPPPPIQNEDIQIQNSIKQNVITQNPQLPFSQVLPFRALNYISGMSPPPLPNVYTPPQTNSTNISSSFNINNTSNVENKQNLINDEQPSSQNKNRSQLFIPTQLRVKNKEINKQKQTANKLSSINQVTAYSTGTHRTQNTNKNDNIPTITAKQFISNISAKKKAEIDTQTNLDQAFNDFLKQVQKT